MANTLPNLAKTSALSINMGIDIGGVLGVLDPQSKYCGILDPQLRPPIIYLRPGDLELPMFLVVSIAFLCA